MNARDKEAGKLRPGDLIQVEHHEHDGPPCCGKWDIKAAVVDETDKASVACDGIAVIGWHDEDHPTCCGVMVVGASTKIPYRGHQQAAA